MSTVLFEDEVATLPTWLPAFPLGGPQMASDDDGPPGDDEFEDDEDEEFEDEEADELEDEELEDEDYNEDEDWEN